MIFYILSVIIQAQDEQIHLHFAAYNVSALFLLLFTAADVFNRWVTESHLTEVTKTG